MLTTQVSYYKTRQRCLDLNWFRFSKETSITWFCGLMRHVLDREVKGSNLATIKFFSDLVKYENHQRNVGIIMDPNG